MLRFTGCLAVALATLAFVDRAVAAEWVSLFNGKNLDGWKAIDGPMSAWKVEDGLLYCSGGGGGWLSSDKEYADFEIELEFRVPPGGNSGVFLRAPHQGNPAFAGMEIQILDDKGREYTKLQPYQYCGSLYDLEPPKTRVSKPAGEWQKMHITCSGRNVKVSLNDTPIVDADLDQYKGKLATHPGLTRTAGYVGLQNHGTRLDFRNIRLRELP
jgi:3-keto-disaccharide hydrolase